MTTTHITDGSRRTFEGLKLWGVVADPRLVVVPDAPSRG